MITTKSNFQQKYIFFVIVTATVFIGGCTRTSNFSIDFDEVQKQIKKEVEKIGKESGNGRENVNEEMECLGLIDMLSLRKEVAGYVSKWNKDLEDAILVEAVAANINSSYFAWVIIDRKDGVVVFKLGGKIISYPHYSFKKRAMGEVSRAEWTEYKNTHDLDISKLKSVGSWGVPCSDGECFFLTRKSMRTCIVKTCYAPYIYNSPEGNGDMDEMGKDIVKYWKVVRGLITFVDENVQPSWPTRF